jgi:DNA-binding beta-propeller fold protein YncE
VAVGERTDTVYVADLFANTVSVINGATCNGADATGCGEVPPTVPVAPGPDAVAVDEATDTVYVSTGFFNDAPTAAMSVIDGPTCNAIVTSGCGQTPATMETGGFSYGVAVDQATGTVFADSIVGSDLEAFNGATCNSVRNSGCGQVPVSLPTGCGPPTWRCSMRPAPSTRRTTATAPSRSGPQRV